MLQFSCPSLIISYLRPHNGGDKRFFKKAMSSLRSIFLVHKHGLDCQYTIYPNAKDNFMKNQHFVSQSW